MRVFAVLGALMGPSIVSADVFQLTLPVVAAEVFPQGAFVTAKASIDVIPGRHRIDVLLPQSRAVADVRPRVSGATVVDTQVGQNTLYDPRVFDNEAQSAARAALEKAEADERRARGELEAWERRSAALDASEEFLRSIGTGDVLPTADQIAEIAQGIGMTMNANAEARAVLNLARPALQRAVDEAAEALARTAAALAALNPPSETWSLASITIDVAEAGRMTLSQSLFDPLANWRVSYDAILDESAGVVTLNRAVDIAGGAEAWVDTVVVLSTADLGGQTSSTDLGRSIARVVEDAALARSTDFVMAEPMMELDVALNEAFAVMPNLDGPVVSYALAEPITLTPADEFVTVALGDITLDADIYIAATPRFDDVAYLMAELTNETGEPILPGPTRLFRDEALIGMIELPLLPAGDDGTLGFGPERSLALDVTFLDRQEGDRGIIRGQETRQERVRVTARNLGDMARDVRLRYAVPSSQQEDLEIRLDMDPAPTARDVEDKIGVMEWALDLAPRSTEEIALTFDLRWPEGQQLLWRP